MGLNDIHSLSHTKWNCKYHIVFAPKYRRKIFYQEKRIEVGKILRQLCEWKGVHIVEGEVCPDHVHMLVEIPPKMSVSGFMGYLKGKSSTMLYEKFGELKYKYRSREFWCRGYYVDTAGKNAGRIAEYIKHQLEEDRLGSWQAVLRVVRVTRRTKGFARIGNTPGLAGGYLLFAGVPRNPRSARPVRLDPGPLHRRSPAAQPRLEGHGISAAGADPGSGQLPDPGTEEPGKSEKLLVYPVRRGPAGPGSGLLFRRDRDLQPGRGPPVGTDGARCPESHSALLRRLQSQEGRCL